MKLTIQDYYNRAIISGDNSALSLTYISGDGEACPTYRDDLIAELSDAFPGADNVDEIVDAIMRHDCNAINITWL